MLTSAVDVHVHRSCFALMLCKRGVVSGSLDAGPKVGAEFGCGSLGMPRSKLHVRHVCCV